jgi:hypothetical protein
MTSQEDSHIEESQKGLILAVPKTSNSKWIIIVCCLGLTIAVFFISSLLLYRQTNTLSNANVALRHEYDNYRSATNSLQQEYDNYRNQALSEIEQLRSDSSNLNEMKRPMLSSEIKKEDLLGTYTSLGQSDGSCRKIYKLTIKEDTLDLALCLDQYCFERSEIITLEWWRAGTYGIEAIAIEREQHSPIHLFYTVILGNYSIALVSINEEFANGVDVFHKNVDQKP